VRKSLVNAVEFSFLIGKQRSIDGLFLKKFKSRQLMLKPKIGKRELFSWAFYGLILIFVLWLAIIFWWLGGLRPVDSSKQKTVVFTIDRGETMAQIASRLKEVNLIRSPFHFKLYLFLTGKAKKVQAGVYQFAPSMGVSEIARLLIKGITDQRVTIVEGLRQEEIGELLVEKGFVIDLKEWCQTIADQKLEGELFPDTYFFPPKATQGAILKIISRNFEKKAKVGLEAEIQASGLSLKGVLTLASIVEREARADKDRRLVASIILKRWRRGWPLQADATVQYAVASAKCKVPGLFCEWWPKGLNQSDLQVKSAYNTYVYQGLPPGPICNPGLSSVKAVLNPEDSPYWYYLNDENGTMHYAKTDEEQVANIGKYLR